MKSSGSAGRRKKTPAASDPDQPYLVRKYSSRRLYDPAAGRFVTLDDLYKLIRQGRRIQAVDSKGKDITRSVLLQLLAEREEAGRPLLSTEALHQMVRLYGDVLQGLFENFLQEGLGALQRQHAMWQDGVQEAMREGTAAAMTQLIEQQMHLWKDSQNFVLGALGAKPASPGRRRRDDD